MKVAIKIAIVIAAAYVTGMLTFAAHVAETSTF